MPIFIALAVTNDELKILEVDVLNAQPKAFDQPQPATVQKTGH